MHPAHDLPDVCGVCGSPWPLCECPPTTTYIDVVHEPDEGDAPDSFIDAFLAAAVVVAGMASGQPVTVMTFGPLAGAGLPSPWDDVI